MAGPLRVLVVTEPLEPCGVALYTENLIKGLVGLGHKVTALTPGGGMLARLQAFGRRIRPKTLQMWLLEAQFHDALENPAGRDEACRAARDLARSERDRTRVDRVCKPR